VNQMKIASSRLITSDVSGWIYIWSMGPEHEVLHRLQTHRLSVMSLDWDDTTILSGGKDGTIKLQDMHSGRLLGRLGRDAACVWKVGFLGNGKVALLVSREGPAMLEIWDVG
jgi:WD40 repeat protein